MKFKSQYSLFLLGLLALASCKKDNYDAPSSQFTAQLVYQGEPLGFENYRVSYELYQPGFGKIGPIGSAFNQEGQAQALLFNGNYKMIVPSGQGPFLWPKNGSGAPDSLAIAINGSLNMNIEVQPFYMLRSVAITGTSTAIGASFNLEQVVTDADAKNIEEVGLFVNRTAIVAPGDFKLSEARVRGADLPGLTNITLSASTPSVTPAQNYMFARVGVKFEGVEDWLYSQVQKIEY